MKIHFQEMRGLLPLPNTEVGAVQHLVGQVLCTERRAVVCPRNTSHGQTLVQAICRDKNCPTGFTVLEERKFRNRHEIRANRPIRLNGV